VTRPFANSHERAAYGAAALMAVAGIVSFFAPAPQWRVTPYSEPTPSNTPSGTADSATGAEKPENAVSFGDFFDHSALPAPVAPEPPPPDPAAALKRFVYVGSAASDGRMKALFMADGSVQSLAIGEALAGFRLTGVEPAAAVFEADGLVVRLPLGALQ